MSRPRRVALCARCGHPWNKHATPGEECSAIVGWRTFDPIRWEPAFCPCTRFRRRLKGSSGGYEWRRLFDAESLLLIGEDLIECPAPECGAPCTPSDISNEGVCRYCGTNILELLADWRFR